MDPGILKGSFIIALNDISNIGGDSTSILCYINVSIIISSSSSSIMMDHVKHMKL